MISCCNLASFSAELFGNSLPSARFLIIMHWISLVICTVQFNLTQVVADVLQQSRVLIRITTYGLHKWKEASTESHKDLYFKYICVDHACSVNANKHVNAGLREEHVRMLNIIKACLMHQSVQCLSTALDWDLRSCNWNQSSTYVHQSWSVMQSSLQVHAKSIESANLIRVLCFITINHELRCWGSVCVCVCSC